MNRLLQAFGFAPAPRLDGKGQSALPGRCNVCGRRTRFLYSDPALYRESLNCVHCLTTSRYRSMARGLLEAFRLLADVKATSLAGLPRARRGRRLAVYDTQVPFDAGASAYPIPTLLERCGCSDGFRQRRRCIFGFSQLVESHAKFRYLSSLSIDRGNLFFEHIRVW